MAGHRRAPRRLHANARARGRGSEARGSEGFLRAPESLWEDRGATATRCGELTGPAESARWGCTAYCTESGPAMSVSSTNVFLPDTPMNETNAFMRIYRQCSEQIWAGLQPAGVCRRF